MTRWETGPQRLGQVGGVQGGPGEWPADVIARYVTVGGATVDITVVSEPEEPYQATHCYGVKGSPEECVKLTVLATCWGCPAYQQLVSGRLFATVLNNVESTSQVRDARRWAQEHADRCRALPRLGVVG